MFAAVISATKLSIVIPPSGASIYRMALLFPSQNKHAHHPSLIMARGTRPRPIM